MIPLTEIKIRLIDNRLTNLSIACHVAIGSMPHFLNQKIQDEQYDTTSGIHRATNGFSGNKSRV